MIRLFMPVILVLCLCGCGNRDVMPPSQALHSPERIGHAGMRRIFIEAIAALNKLRDRYPDMRVAEPRLYVKAISELSPQKRLQVKELRQRINAQGLDSLSPAEINQLQELLAGISVELRMNCQQKAIREMRDINATDLGRNGIYFRLTLFPRNRLIPSAKEPLQFPALEMFGYSHVVVAPHAPAKLDGELRAIMHKTIQQLQAIPAGK